MKKHKVKTEKERLQNLLDGRVDLFTITPKKGIFLEFIPVTMFTTRWVKLFCSKVYTPSEILLNDAKICTLNKDSFVRSIDQLKQQYENQRSNAYFDSSQVLARYTDFKKITRRFVSAVLFSILSLLVVLFHVTLGRN